MKTELFKKSKKGARDIMHLIESAIVGIVGIVILFKVVASLFPTLVSAGSELNASGLPLGSLFAGQNAVLFLILAVTLVVLGISLFFGLMKAGKGGRY